MKSTTFILLLMVSGWASTNAQVTIIEPPAVQNLVRAYIEKNKEVTDVQGWRIQLVATTDRRHMESTRAEFRREFPDIKSSWFHKAPYYQVQVGAYCTKQEALPVLEEVKERFPKAYLVVDRIEYSELNEQL
ncbi:MAG: SPOR domain-containing protein [Saprospiraceae bacterium]|nr:SPOR domain-containing protein [Saprospiraceae bacterium]